jgi:lipopolysaccharide transport system ATP-binding protein
LRAVRVLSAGGLAEAVDISRPLEIEMEYEVLLGGTVLVPHLDFQNEEGLCLFISVGQGDSWRRRPRPPGRYRSRVTVPENFFAEGNIVVHAAISTLDPRRTHVRERDAVAFQVIDNLSGDTARGDYAGHLAGVVRPMLQWHTVTDE